MADPSMSSQADYFQRLLMLLHGTPPAEQDTADTVPKKPADAAKSGDSAGSTSDKTPAKPVQPQQQDFGSTPITPDALTRSILNMGQIMPVTPAQPVQGKTGGGSNFIDSLSKVTGGSVNSAQTGPGGLETMIASIAKFFA